MAPPAAPLFLLALAAAQRGSALAGSARSDAPNMNGEYVLSQTPGGDRTQQKFPTHFRDYPRGVRYFDVYSPPVKTLYAQVFWTGLDPVPLPDDIIERYAGGRGMAVVGFEVDQVRRTPEGDVSVPMNVVYNHHHNTLMTGAGSRLEKIKLTGPEDPRIVEYGLDKGHSLGTAAGTEHWVAIDTKSNGGSIPSKHHFGAANGGENRKSFHGFAPGFAQVIASPEKFQITPMAIDTWHREKMNLTGSPFVAGPLPRNSWAGPDAQYSGLLECPVTTRVRKIIDAGYEAIVSGTCNNTIDTAAECFAAAAKELSLIPHGLRVTNRSVSDSAGPSACSLVSDPSGGAATVYFNHNKEATGKCGAGEVARSGMTRSLVTVNVSLDIAADQATITVSGPESVWYGVGFNAQQMKDAPWAIIVDGYGTVSERKLADQGPGTQLPPSVSVMSSTTANGLRTVVVTRPLRGRTQDYFSFSAGQGVVLPFINAVGSGADLAYHHDKSASTLALLPVSGGPGAAACVCASNPAPFGQGKGAFSYVPVDQPGEMGRPTTIDFCNTCAPQPRTDLLAMKNPTCDIRSYVGGQCSCHHMFSLLDADQAIPWPDQPLEFQLKWRFWYQDYNASYHTNVERTTTWGIASPIEYDVPKCEEGMLGCSRQDGRWVHTITGTYQGQGTVVAAHFHCHAPTCLSMKMYRDWNGTHGNLICEQRPVYGGTGKIDEKKFDEPGYILQPPCLWGSAEFGLEPPPDLEGVTMHSVKTADAAYGHHGEMAWQQMFFVKDIKK